jgi:hypothetical protein
MEEEVGLVLFVRERLGGPWPCWALRGREEVVDVEGRYEYAVE